jgi:hypothetical protein
VLRDATRYALCEICDLSALHVVDHCSDVLVDLQPFPTWAVRADLQRRHSDIGILPVFFRACEGLADPSSLGDVSNGEDVLLLEGLLVDEVLQTTITYIGVWEQYQAFFEWLVSVKTMTMQHCDLAMHEDTYLAMAFTLSAGRAYSRVRARPEDLDTLVEYLKSLPTHEGSVTSKESSIAERIDRGKIDAMYSATHVSNCKSRRFFVTTAGRTGLGPRSMQPGDLVVILRGGRTPFVLRKKADGYWLIGPAYVHGLMDGEVVQDGKYRGRSEEVFPVR